MHRVRGVAFMVEFINAIFYMFNEAALYLLVGFGVAGMVRYLLAEERVLRWFGRDDFGSVMIASLLGIPLPLCSCSVLPVAVAMRQRGASRGAVASFSVSTPETGVDSISITYALLDPIMTVARPVTALATALVTGSAVNWLYKNDPKDGDQNGIENGQDGSTSDACAGEDDAGGSCCCSAKSPGETPEGQPEEDGNFFLRSLRFGYVTLVDDMVSILVFAFVFSGLITVILPDRFFEFPMAQGFSGMLLMLFVGIPFYICATGSTPIVASLMLKGLSPGAAIVFLLAGPATNAGTVIALIRYLGKKAVAAYLICVAGMTLLAGLVVESIYKDYSLDPAKVAGQVSETVPSTIKVIASLIFGCLLLRSAVVTGMLSSWGEYLRKICRPLRFDPLGGRARLAAVAAVLILYAQTSFSIVNPGEVGWVVRFGEVTRSLDKPGLAVHLPWPFESVEVCRADQVRTVELGFERVPASEEPYGFVNRGLGGEFVSTELESESEVMNGDESIVAVRFSVHYSLSDPYRYLFRNSEPDEAVRAFSESAVRVICSAIDTSTILVGHRTELEELIHSLIQRELDNMEAGVRILGVTLLDVHAPPSVHADFRDVASASEDKVKFKREAESDYNEKVALARGEAYRILREAEIYKDSRLTEARGRADAFLERAEAYASSRELTRLRLYIDTMESILSTTGVIIPLDSGIAVDLWLKSLPPAVEENNEKGGDKRSGERESTEMNIFPWEQ